MPLARLIGDLLLFGSVHIVGKSDMIYGGAYFSVTRHIRSNCKYSTLFKLNLQIITSEGYPCYSDDGFKDYFHKYSIGYPACVIGTWLHSI